MSHSNCCFLTCIQISQETGKVIWYSHLFKNFSQFVVIHTVKGFNIVNEAEVDFFWNSLAFSVTQQMLAIWSLVPLSFLNPACTQLKNVKFSVYVLLKPILKDFEHYLDSMWNECNCAVVWAFFGIAFLWDWNENWPFPGCGYCWVFQICWHIECSILTASSFRILNSPAGIPSPPVALFIVVLPKAHFTLQDVWF